MLESLLMTNMISWNLIIILIFQLLVSNYNIYYILKHTKKYFDYTTDHILKIRKIIVIWS